MRITRMLLLSAAAIVMTGGAYAADLIVSEPEPMMMAPASAHDWSGAYVGISGGYAMGTVDWTGEYFAGGVGGGEFGDDFDVSGWLLGAQAGANVQFDSFVLGVEGDISWTNISGEGDGIGPGPDFTVPSASIDWIGTLRGRAGVAFDQVLVYATAGFAYGAGEVGLTNLDGALDDRTADLTAGGWVAGIGAEVALDDNLSIKGEYTYTSLTMDEIQFGDVLPADYLAVNGDVGIHTFKVGLNYAF